MPDGLPTDSRITYSQQYRRCHKAGCSHCNAGGKGHGPYWFAYWREAGKLRSRYLGKQMPSQAVAAEPAVAMQTNIGTPIAGAPNARPQLSVRTLGAFEVLRGGTPVSSVTWRRRTVLAFFTCLLSAPEQRLHREQLIEAVWPDKDLATATRELHRTIHLLRKALDQPGNGSGAIRLAGDMVLLDLSGTTQTAPDWLDAAVFSRMAASALHGRNRPACRDALALYGGNYMPDDPYSEWVVVRREELQGQYLAVLLHLASLSGDAGDHEEAENCLRKVLQQDACQEGAATVLMGMLAAAGRRIDALRVYQVLASALEADLGLAPSNEIEALRSRLQSLEAAPVAANLPPRAPLPAQPGNLPAPLTSFIGRAWERTELMEVLTGTRLLTLTGPGGCGKTRLALETAGNLHPRYQDGIWLVELAALRDPELVPRAVASTLGTQEDMKGISGAALYDALCEFLRPRQVLLLLDNCEHLIGACAELATALLRGCPGLSILATSREALAITGETAWYVPPLATPHVADLPSLEAALRFEAVQLFVDRARASRPGFTLSDENLAPVLQVCRRLDGLPLAIELAAARLGTLPVEGVAARLNDCFSLLTGGSRTALPRQQTLRATMDWSYGLLSDAEQALLSRLAVFAGGWTLEAAAAICVEASPVDAAAAHSRASSDQMLDLLTELRARSLVQVTEHHAALRYRLLETVRQYAQEKLVASGDAAAVQERHRLWFLDQLSQAGDALKTPERTQWLGRLEDDLDNLRIAVASSMRRPTDREAILQRAEPLTHLCLVRGHIVEGRRWLTEALADSCGEGTAARAMALNAAGTLASEQGDYRQAAAFYDAGLALYRALGDTRGTARLLINQGTVMKYQGEAARASDLYEAGVRLARELEDPSLLAIALNNVGTLAIEQQNTEYAAVVLEESVALKRQSGTPSSLIFALINLGEVARSRDDFTRATDCYEEALVLSHALGDRSHVALLHYNLGLVARAQNNNGRAVTEFCQSLVEEHDLGNKRQIAANIEGLAGVAACSGQFEQASRLFGAAEHLREQIGAPVPAADRAGYDRDIAQARSSLTPARAAAVWSQGRATAPETAIAEALAVRVAA